MDILDKIIIIILIIIFTILTINYFSKAVEGLEDNLTPLEVIKRIYNMKGEIIHEDDSEYQNIKIVEFKEKDQSYPKQCLMLNDEMQLCNSDEQKYHETIVHYPAAYLKKMENVLIIGGGDLMALREVMKYESINNVKMLEIDQDVIDVSQKYFDVNNFENDPRVEIIIGNATKTINKLKNNYFDLIIVDTTEDSNNNSPIDTYSFLNKCKKKLKKNGMFIKNGNNPKNTLSIAKIFNYTDVISVNTETFMGDYFMIVAADINFNKLQNKETKKLEKKLDYYNSSIH